MLYSSRLNNQLRNINSERKILALGRLAVGTPDIQGEVNYSTVTDLAKLRGWSTSVPLMMAT